MNDAPEIIETNDVETTTVADDKTAKEVKELYEELGVDKKVEANKSSTKPKSKAGNIKSSNKTKRQDDNDSQSKKGQSRASGGQDKSEDESADDKTSRTGAKGRKEASQTKEDSKSDAEKPAETGEDARRTESETEEGSGQGGETGAEQDREADDESSEQDEGKRPGKSDPKIERRFQRLISESKEKDQVIEDLQRQLQQQQQLYYQQQVENEDPEYTVDDFRTVQDRDGNIIDLNENEAELAWRRWKDGYNQRQAERQAEQSRQIQMQQQEQELQMKVMQNSADAYDLLTNMVDDYPELDVNSDKFDQELSDLVMPIIHDTVIYQPGTEPGNPDGHQPVIAGLRMDPTTILDTINQIRNTKPALSPEELYQNVDTPSQYTVRSPRSSSEATREVNELYKELGINKRI